MIAVFGKTLGLKGSEINALRRIGRRRVNPDDTVSLELARELAELTGRIGRRVGVLLDRRGRVCHVCVGDARALAIPGLGDAEKHNLRLRGLRLIHTHLAANLTCLPSEYARPDLVDLLRFRLDCSVRLTVSDEGTIESVTRAQLLPPNRDGEAFRIEEIRGFQRLHGIFTAEITALEEEFARLRPRARDISRAERAILVGVWKGDRDAADRSMGELAALAAAGGAEVVDTIMQRREAPDTRTLIGRGKVWELNILALHRGADVVIFNHELTPGMARNLDGELPVKLIDRTQLILDIFAQRATSAEGKLEVELARLLYALPRLRTDDERMPQIRGGIGSDRGVGEPQIELDRRKIKRRIALLEKRLAKISAQRRELRKHREKNKVPVVALVGYTNAGKTTMLNRLAAANAPSGPQLFMTLQSVSRRFTLPDGRRTIVVDTVGFIRDLPPGLMRAFKATLEELQGADLLLHVADAADPDVFGHIEVVERVLEEIALGDRPRSLIFNKIDVVDLPAFKPLMKGRPAEYVAAISPGLGRFFEDLLMRELPAGSAQR